MSSGGPPTPPPLPAGYRPGDRVRVVDGMFATFTGVVLGPAPDCPLQPAVLVRLRIYERDVDIAFPVNPPPTIERLEPAPPA